MKRVVVGTFNQCMIVIRKSERMKDAGYDYYELHESTQQEYEDLINRRGDLPGRSTQYHAYVKPYFRAKKFLAKEFYTLTLYRD